MYYLHDIKLVIKVNYLLSGLYTLLANETPREKIFHLRFSDKF